MPELECDAEALEHVIQETLAQWPDGMLLAVKAVVDIEFSLRVMHRNKTAAQDH